MTIASTAAIAVIVISVIIVVTMIRGRRMNKKLVNMIYLLIR